MRVELKLKYIQSWTDEHGRKRYRFRRKGYARIELPVNAEPSSVEFQAAYFAALRGERQDHALAMVTARGGTGSVGHAIEEYLSSTTFRDFSETTKELRRPILKCFLAPGIGNLPLKAMDQRYINRWLEGASTLNTKRNRLLAIRPFLQWCISPMGLIQADPTKDITVKIRETGGHATWTAEQVVQFRDYYPLGTKARLALELLLGLALSRGDAIALGRAHVKNGWVSYTQGKNRKRKPVKVEAPMPPELIAAIEACPAPPESLTFLVNEWGRPFTEDVFTLWFRKQIAAAGLPNTCRAHGLRKASCTAMANAGCVPHEIMSVSGHRTLREVVRYTEAADRRRLAAQARAKVASAATARAEAASNVVPIAAAKR
jgi:integrase